ncbi:MAG: methionyl-tRNA formyltransferase [Bacteroidia bacterium]|nr:methionyl-tRNA formyltransferase [Bacteroidia bacterium]
MNKLRILFMGTPEFAVASLMALKEAGHNIVGVVTTADKPAGRGQIIHQSAVKEYALKHDLKLLQPVNLKDEKFIEELRHLNADLQLVVAFRMLPEAVWNMPRLGTFNLHASLLPRYRGAAPINWAIINGDDESGVTTFKLKHQIDTGNILFSEKVKILANTSAGELHDALKETGATLFLRTVNAISKSDEDGTALPFSEQDNTLVSHAPKIFRETCRINWDKDAKSIHNLIRGLSPYPAAFTELHNEGLKPLTVKIYKAVYILQEEVRDNGKLITDNKSFLRVKCLGGCIEIMELQMEGKKRMRTDEFLRGYSFREGSVFV